MALAHTTRCPRVFEIVAGYGEPSRWEVHSVGRPRVLNSPSDLRRALNQYLSARSPWGRPARRGRLPRALTPRKDLGLPRGRGAPGPEVLSDMPTAAALSKARDHMVVRQCALGIRLPRYQMRLRTTETSATTTDTPSATAARTPKGYKKT